MGRIHTHCNSFQHTTEAEDVKVLIRSKDNKIRTKDDTGRLVLEVVHLKQKLPGWDCLVGRGSDQKASHNSDRGSIPWCDKGFFSHGRLSVQTLLWCSYKPSVQSHTSKDVGMSILLLDTEKYCKHG